MREIKFRGKRKDNGQWVCGYYLKYACIDNGVMVDCITSPDESVGYYSGEIVPHEIIPETLGQFTGLTDKNGKEIYEGDVVFEGENKINGILSYQLTQGGYELYISENDKWNIPLAQLDSTNITVLSTIHDGAGE